MLNSPATSSAKIDSASSTSPMRAGLPAWTYRSAELLDLEYQEIILKSWQIACHISDLPNPRSYFTLELMRDSLLIVRDDEGELRAFKNVCRHRASRLLDGQGDCPRRLICPYHGWAYKLNGELAAVPAEGTFPGLEKDKHGLMPVELEVFHGFIFLRVEGGGPSVAELWGDIGAQLDAYDIPGMVRLDESWEGVWDVNWKVAIDNNMENYHIPIGHPGYHRMLENDLDGFGNERGVSGSVSRLKEKEGNNWSWSERAYRALALETLADRPKELARRWTFYSMLPNLGVDVYPDCLDFFQILPLGAKRAKIRTMIYGHPDKRREMRLLRYLNGRINGKVAQEDFELCHRVQQGLETQGYELGPLSSYETGVREFHDLVRERVPAAQLAQEPFPGELARLNAAMLAERDA